MASQPSSVVKLLCFSMIWSQFRIEFRFLLCYSVPLCRKRMDLLHPSSPRDSTIPSYSGRQLENSLLTKEGGDGQSLMVDPTTTSSSQPANKGGSTLEGGPSPSLVATFNPYLLGSFHCLVPLSHGEACPGQLWSLNMLGSQARDDFVRDIANKLGDFFSWVVICLFWLLLFFLEIGSLYFCI